MKLKKNVLHLLCRILFLIHVTAFLVASGGASITPLLLLPSPAAAAAAACCCCSAEGGDGTRVGPRPLDPLWKGAQL